jgi:hypothetical protein
VPDDDQAGAAPAARGPQGSGWRGRLRAFLRTPAARDSLVALAASRLLIWAVGVPAYLLVGVGPDVKFDHALLTQSQGPVGNALIAPAVRWDSNWYVDTAVAGYLREDRQPVFYPLYPLLMRGVGALVGSVLVAGILISLVAFFAALVMLHRLTERELGREAARRTVFLLAFFPFSLFFSAVYTEALFLALMLAAFWAARGGRWWLAGLVGAAASATRNTGVLLAPILLFLYLYGPRDDAEPRADGRRWAPRHRLRPDVAWLALVPLGLVAYLTWLGVRYGDPLVPFHAQETFQRSFQGPLSAVWLGAFEAVKAVGALVSGGVGGGAAAVREIGLFGVAVLAVVAAVGVLRRLPAVYGVFTVVMMVPVLSFPQAGHPLASASRYLAVVFPLFMWAGWRLSDRRLYRATLVVFALGLVYTSAMFATWRFVA